MNERYKLFGDFAARYDLHTRPEIYQPEHQLVLEELARYGAGARVLDVGCGTGAFLQRARDAGFDASGIDAAPEMIAVAEQRLGAGVARVQRLQDLAETGAYDALISLSLPFNYCADVAEARRVLASFYRALRPGGLLLMQVAHAANATGCLMEDWERGPGGEDDIQLLCRFSAVAGSAEPTLRAQYVYSCRSLHELFYEEHLLHVADAPLVIDLMRETGFVDLRLYDSFRREPLTQAVGPFVLGLRPAAEPA